jgi:hypothetical protein
MKGTARGDVVKWDYQSLADPFWPFHTAILRLYPQVENPPLDSLQEWALALSLGGCLARKPGQ